MEWLFGLLSIIVFFIYLVAIGQQFPEGDKCFIVFMLNWNNSQREQLWGQMALNLLQMPSIQLGMNVQMCQPAKWMCQLGENAAETHLNVKITEKVKFIHKRGTAVDDGCQWGQLNKK
jgi:hypothetical protein